MNVQEFQNKLKEVQEIARQHGNALNAAEIRHVFEECDLDKSQLLGVLKYLTSQGILIEGLETAGEEAKEPEHKKIPLTAEEEAYLKNYLEELPVVDEVDAKALALLGEPLGAGAAGGGDEPAAGELLTLAQGQAEILALPGDVGDGGVEPELQLVLQPLIDVLEDAQIVLCAQVLAPGLEEMEVVAEVLSSLQQTHYQLC